MWTVVLWVDRRSNKPTGWLYPLLEESIQEGGLETINTYIDHRQNPGAWVPKWWWEQGDGGGGMGGRVVGNECLVGSGGGYIY